MVLENIVGKSPKFETNPHTGKTTGTMNMIEFTPKELFDRALSTHYGIAYEFGSNYEARTVRRKLYAEREKYRKQNIEKYNAIKLLVRGRELLAIPKAALENKSQIYVESVRELDETAS